MMDFSGNRVQRLDVTFLNLNADPGYSAGFVNKANTAGLLASRYVFAVLFVCLLELRQLLFSHGFYFNRDQENYQIVHLDKFHIYELNFWDSQKCFMSDNTKICKPISFRPCNCTDPNLGNSPTSSQRLILTAIQQSQCLSPQRIMGLRTDICSGRNPLSPDQVILAKLP